MQITCAYHVENFQIEMYTFCMGTHMRVCTWYAHDYIVCAHLYVHIMCAQLYVYMTHTICMTCAFSCAHMYMSTWCTHIYVSTWYAHVTTCACACLHHVRTRSKWRAHMMCVDLHDMRISKNIYAHMIYMIRTYDLHDLHDVRISTWCAHMTCAHTVYDT